MWYCDCDCGTKHKIIEGSSLKSNKTKSCGCYNIEKIIERNTKRNHYDLSGEYGIGYDSKGEEFYFDLEDFDLIKDYCWQVDTYGYVVTTTVRMHRLIMNVNDLNIDVDHKNHNTKDNRKGNLRLTTKSQNQMNKKKSKNNTSGVTGVSFMKNRNKWISYIQKDNKNHILGYFVNFEEAVNARKDAEEKLFGEYSYKNSIKEGDIL